MESFVYVVLYHALRYLEHNGRLSVPTILANIFDSEELDIDGIVLGGTNKQLLFLRPQSILGYGFKFHSEPLDIWWNSVRPAVKQWHDHLDLELSAKVKRERTVNRPSAVVVHPEPLPSLPSQLALNTHDHMDVIFKEQLDSSWPEHEPPPNDAAPYSGLTSTTARAQRSSTKRSSALVDSTDASTGLSRKRHQGSHPSTGKSGRDSGSKRRRGGGSGTT
ncbi:hypothetical protein H0H87_001258 [Tephrocybe sp. NHM501043]|nr:hypothetical protein H0H87_001258 [Tephrocybe sp. NHM501043]